jgi:hypothetical protein
MPLINDPDSLTWGRLVKSWATGLDYINTPSGQQPPTKPIPTNAPWALDPLKPVSFPATVDGKPVTKTIPGVLAMTPDDLTKKLLAAGVSSGMNYPDGVVDVLIIQGDATTMILRLPPKSVLQYSEQKILTGEDYPTPTFYDALYSPPDGPVAHATPPRMPRIDELMRLHANRIGDYTMGLCQ